MILVIVKLKPDPAAWPARFGAARLPDNHQPGAWESDR